MIDWGNVPAGAVASIYWPQVPAAEVVELADSLYASHTLAAADANTITCRVTGGVTYVPIPARNGENFAGLLTVDLPAGVTAGQKFSVVVRRLTSRDFPPVIELRSPAATAGSAGAAPPRDAEPGPVDSQAEGWRAVVGTFQIDIPVATSATMLLPEENTLAILKWRLENLPVDDRWRPVIERLVQYVAARVDGLGGRSVAIEPSPEGVPLPTRPRHHARELTGKVERVLFDCHGAFEGFVLDSCRTHHTLPAHGEGISRVVLYACRHGMTLTVHLDADGDHIMGLVLVS